MCNAAAVGAGSLGLNLTGGIFSSFQARNAGEANGLYYDSLEKRNRGLADISRIQGEVEANYAQNEGAQQTKVLLNKEKKFQATQKATLAANGIDTGSVTAEDISKDTFDSFKMDELAIRLQADQKAFQGKNYGELRALDYQTQADANKLSAENARTEGQTRLYTGLINTAASTAESGFKMYKAGVFDDLFNAKSIDLQDTIPDATNRYDLAKEKTMLGKGPSPAYQEKAYKEMFGDIGISADTKRISKEFSSPASVDAILKDSKVNLSKPDFLKNNNKKK